MNCRDFDRIWNQTLDARRRGAIVDDAWIAGAEALHGHAESCASCRARHRRFETLLQALEAWTARPAPGPKPSVELADRIIAAASRPGPSEADRPSRVRPRVAAFALASAAALLLAVIGPRLRPRSRPTADAPTSAATTALDDVRQPLRRGLLGSAVGDATAASWQLALLASEPAARLGKDMIDASFDPDADGDSSRPSGLPAASDLPSLDAETFSPNLINQMGGVLAEGVRPLSTSARHAFGFLRAPNTEKPERPARPTAGKGA